MKSYYWHSPKASCHKEFLEGWILPAIMCFHYACNKLITIYLQPIEITHFMIYNGCEFYKWWSAIRFNEKWCLQPMVWQDRITYKWWIKKVKNYKRFSQWYIVYCTIDKIFTCVLVESHKCHIYTSVHTTFITKPKLQHDVTSNWEIQCFTMNFLGPPNIERLKVLPWPCFYLRH